MWDERVGSATVEEWLVSPYLRRAAARVAHQYGLGEDDLADLLQELRIALWQAGPGTRFGPAWIFQVATHKVIDVIRRRSIARRRDRAFADLPAPASDSELGHLLHARVSELPPRLQQFYRLHYEEGWSEREIADRLGICRASVRWLDHCCRREVTATEINERRRRAPGPSLEAGRASQRR